MNKFLDDTKDNLDEVDDKAHELKGRVQQKFSDMEDDDNNDKTAM